MMDAEYYQQREPEAIPMEPNYQHYQQLSEPAQVLHDYYNDGDEDEDDDDDDILNEDPKMVMIRQINEDGKDWSEEDISDLETDAKNDTLPPQSVASTNMLSNPLLHASNQPNLQHISEQRDPNAPHYVNVTDLINNIGFGKFHYQLIFLCGLGYVADSMWGSAITLIINPVQNEWNVDTMYLGWLAATLFSGMCIGSFVWGRTSDIVGRKFPFTLTLAIGGIIGMICAFMPSFNWLLALLLVLGFGVGGNIPVDGAILAEFLPTSHRGSIMVSLSIFWALGDLVSAFLAYLIIPNHICKSRDACDTVDNLGWRYFIFSLGAINCCFLFFRLGTNESPNYLICQGEGGRRRALSVLKSIAAVNECPKDMVTNNMILQVDNPILNRKLVARLSQTQTLQQQRMIINHPNHDSHVQQQTSHVDTEHAASRKSVTSLESVNLASSKGRNGGKQSARSSISSLSHYPEQHHRAAAPNMMMTTTHINTNANSRNAGRHPHNVNLDLDLEAHQMSWSDIIGELFSNKTHGRNLRRATPIIWLAWFLSAFGFNSFAVFLPKFMAAKQIHISTLYGDALTLAIASLPGPFIGAYMVETHRFGRRYTMTVSGVITSVCILLFIFVETELGLVILACLISLLAQIWFAGLMCFTPEAYPTDIRTTASGIATGVRHVANILGPIVTGKTFGHSGTTPLIMAAMALLCAAIATYFLPFDTRKKRLVPTVRVS
eukprot:CAMPEP_0202691562 /NCGR_PEP_ID=MMETSP1385-20130828/6244_1 /ASSEMBLY_ACC=CAM_ASM_000861 /TAXON_ID=933848 /ORGANISM="Elphidium margaritaceum" /LENGTH=719 /DNA_ID=CAMNT_0049346989 /DNA_START=44 /DNA_END=2199 /DNA_ORIENTATION=-